MTLSFYISNIKVLQSTHNFNNLSLGILHTFGMNMVIISQK